MRSVFFIFIIIVLYSFQTLFCTLFNKAYAGPKRLASTVFCTLEGLTIAIGTLCFIGFRFRPSPATWLIGLGTAAADIVYNISLLRGTDKGPYAMLNIVMLFGGLILPILYAALFLDSPVTPLKCGAVILMLISLFIMNAQEMKLRGLPKIFYLYCVLLFLSNGIYGILVAAEGRLHSAESNQMIVIAFAVMGIFSLLQLLLKEKGSAKEAFRIGKKAVLPLVICLLSATAAINLLVYIMPLVDVAALYTYDNGGVMVLSAIYSFTIFREKLTWQKIVGIVLAVISMVALSI